MIYKVLDIREDLDYGCEERSGLLLSEAVPEDTDGVKRYFKMPEALFQERDELVEKADESAVEHAELIAPREFVYNHTSHDENIDLDEESRTEIIGKIKEKKVCILGGTEKWIKRMLPSWSYIGVDDNSIGAVGALERADYIYIYTDALKPAQYYRAMNIVKSKGKVMYYLGSSNVDECLRQFGSELNR